MLIIAGFWIYLGVNRGTVNQVGYATPTSTRAAQSYSAEGDAHFTSGDLGSAISAYRKALDLDPNNAQIWATLARIQTYNSSLKTTDSERRVALTDALASNVGRIEKLEVEKSGHVRRAKLYYLRKRVGKTARLRERAN